MIVVSNLKRGIATHEQQVQAADRIEQLEADIQEMVKKAADNNLDGYREMGQKIAEQESTIEQLQADLLLLWKLDTYSDDPHEYRELLEKYAPLEKDDGS